MSCRAWLIDPWAFARNSGRRDGAMRLADLPRLANLAASPGSVLDVVVVGSVAHDEHSYIHIDVSGMVRLTCQRCLETVEHVIRHQALFQLWPADVAPPDDELLEDEFDALPAGKELDLVQLVEDEVLLELPLSPRHSDCKLPRSSVGVAAASPFDALKRLKRPH